METLPALPQTNGRNVHRSFWGVTIVTIQGEVGPICHLPDRDIRFCTNYIRVVKLPGNVRALKTIPLLPRSLSEPLGPRGRVFFK